MTQAYDLHTHSTASDGTLDPTRLVSNACAAGVRVLALTDHDTTEGLEEAREAARRVGITTLGGVEISVTWGGMTVHIVGLGIDETEPRLQSGLKSLRAFRDWRAAEIGRKLEQAGIEGAFDGALQYSSGRLVSRTHFARYLVERGRSGSVREVFRHYLVRGKPGHVAGQWAELEDAVGWVKAAGGQTVIAHPARYKMTRTKLRRLIGEFKECGGVALEVVSGSHSKDECFTMARHAADYGLLSSMGSDYHGPENPYIDLGRLPPLPPLCVPIWSQWDEDIRKAAMAAAHT